ncbi:MAG: hypothetical protein KC900_14260 [Candidatus Omnitrophica bacterium]|nr:hypothetical protein [Candidatus Omnitrophota bacterium]
MVNKGSAISKMELAVMVLAAAGLLGASAYFLFPDSMPSGGTVDAKMKAGQRRTVPALLRDAYRDYNQTVNSNRDTYGVLYYPCPAGYDCRGLIPPELLLPADEVVFDYCGGDREECLILAIDMLIRSGIEDVEAYLADRGAAEG